MKIHYLEIVTPEVDAVCATYEAAQAISFGDPDPLLGGARTATGRDGTIIGVRGPLRDDEAPIVRPYWLVDDIDAAVSAAAEQGARIALAPLELPGKGRFAILIHGGVDHGFWQR